MIAKRSKGLFACAGCAVVALFAGALAVSQPQHQSQPPQPPPPQTGQNQTQTPPLRVTTRMVQVTVVVHDKDGNPVSGLTKDDFALFDQGQRQRIASFTERSNRIAAMSAAAAPNVFSNRYERSAAAQPALTVVVVDAYNTRYWDKRICECIHGPCPPCKLGPLFSQVETFFEEMKPQDRVALYELADKLYLLQDFTNDPSALQRGLDHGKELVAGLVYPPSGTDPIDMSNFTMDAMHAIADRLADVPGRKNLIWLSAGFSGQRIITDEKMDTTAKTLANSDLPLNAVDAHGLDPGGIPVGPVPSGGVGRRGPVDGPPPPGIGNTGAHGGPPGGFNRTRNLAEASGGRAFYNTNDLAGSIRRAIDDSESAYVLGYYPDHNKWNGEFRDIHVKVSRPGVVVRSRPGYYAVAESASGPERNAQKLAEAIRSPLESADLAIDVEGDGVEVPGGRELKVKITLDPTQLRFQLRGDQWTDTVTKVWAEFNSEGRQVGTITKMVNLNPSQEEYRELLQHGLHFSETLALANDAEEIHLVLRDDGNGSIGSVIIPLKGLFAPAAAQPETKK